MQTTDYDPAEVRTLEVRPWIDFASYLIGFELVSLSLGPSGEIFALAVTAPADYREIAPSGASFPRVRTEQPHDVRILRFDGDEISSANILEQHWNYRYVQPLPSGELLLVVARSRRFSDGASDLNAKVFTETGRFVREFLLGDGIADVQITADGQIWSSYFDEGIFQDFGGSEPIGSSGLNCWDRFGNRIYAFSPPSEAGFFRRMTDCYALNVVSESEEWCYYLDLSPSGRFPLIGLRRKQINAVLESPINGSKGIAIGQNHVLFCGRYRHHEEFNLCERIDGGPLRHRLRFNVIDEHGIVLHANRVTVRGSTFILYRGTRCYRVDISDVMQLL